MPSRLRSSFSLAGGLAFCKGSAAINCWRDALRHESKADECDLLVVEGSLAVQCQAVVLEHLQHTNEVVVVLFLCHPVDEDVIRHVELSVASSEHRTDRLREDTHVETLVPIEPIVGRYGSERARLFGHRLLIKSLGQVEL